MAREDLQVILDSGDITGMQLNTTDPGNAVLTKDQVDVIANLKLIYKGEWQAGEYKANDIAKSGDAMWLATTTTSEEPSGAAVDWIFFANTQVTAVGQTYFYIKTSDTLDIAETTPQEIATLNVPDVPAGVYHFFYSFAVDFSTAKDDSLHFQVTDDLAGSVFDMVADKLGNKKNRLYGYPVDHAGGPLTITFSMWKATGFTTQVNVDFCDLVFTRVA